MPKFECVLCAACLAQECISYRQDSLDGPAVVIALYAGPNWALVSLALASTGNQASCGLREWRPRRVVNLKLPSNSLRREIGRGPGYVFVRGQGTFAVPTLS